MRKTIGLVALTAALAGLTIAAGITSAGAATTSYTATLTGAAEIPANGSTYTGTATFQIDDVANTICVESSISADPLVDPVTANHIHTGAAGVSGPPLINFNNNQDTCVAASAQDIAAIKANPAGFYYNVHTEDFPGGGARGQLTLVVASTSSSSTTTTAAPTTTTGCNPNYTGVCIPSNLTNSQVNCTPGANVVFVVTTPVRVIGVDVLRLDGDGDGTGCESDTAAAAATSTPRFTG